MDETEKKMLREFADLVAKKGTNVQAEMVALKEKYQADFKRLDSNNDGSLSNKEFVVIGSDQNPKDRLTSFHAFDDDQDNRIARSEYQASRTIEDTAKAFFTKLDLNSDGKIGKDEFLASKVFSDSKLSQEAFARFDANKNGNLSLSEFSQVWIQWSKQPPVLARLIAKKQVYVLSKEQQGKAFRDRIKKETDDEKLRAALRRLSQRGEKAQE